MGSSGKKKTTMAKMARENKLRERRAIKQAKKDARRSAANDPSVSDELTQPADDDPDAAATSDPGAEAQADEARDAFLDVGREPSDPRAKEVALTRLRDSPDAELAVFEDKLLDDARDAGASEQEVRDAQQHHPGHAGG